MFVTDAISMDDLSGVVLRDQTLNRPLQESVATFCIGDHGPEYQVENPSPATEESILWCGCSLFFPAPTTPGELLFCTFHDDWFKSRPALVKDVSSQPNYRIKCNTCDGKEFAPGSRTQAYTQARRHSYGKKGNKNPRCHVVIGKPTASGTEYVWFEYNRKDN